MSLTADEITVARNFVAFLDAWKRTNGPSTKQKDFAKIIFIDEATLSSWINQKRAIPKNSYHMISEALGVSEDQLTHRPQSSSISYVLVSNTQVVATSSEQLLKSLYNWDNNGKKIIQEMSIVYGDRDILLKVETSNEQDLIQLLFELGRLGQKNYQTYRVVSDGLMQYSWERERRANTDIIHRISNEDYYDPENTLDKINEMQSWLDVKDKKDSFDPFGDYFRIEFGCQEFQDAVKGILKVTKEDLLYDYLVSLAKSVKSSIQGVYVWSEQNDIEKKSDQEYLEVQKRLLLQSEQKIDIRRIFVSDEEYPQDSPLLEMMRKQVAIGVKVYYLQSRKWISANTSIQIQDFAIFDRTVVFASHSPEKIKYFTPTILYTPKSRESLISIKNYQNVFNMNIRISTEFKQV